MVEVSTITAHGRDGSGKGAARALRREGRIPAVIYGTKQAPRSIALDLRLISREIHRAGFFTRLYDLEIDGAAHRVLARDVQFHPVTDVPLHIDFLRFVAGAEISVEVACHFTGEEDCPGLRQGGVLNVVRHTVELNCPVESIPNEIAFSLVDLEIGASIHISAADLPEGVTPTITDRDFTVATIAAPTIMEEPVEEEEDLEGEEGEEGLEGEEGVEGEEGAEASEAGEAKGD